MKRRTNNSMNGNDAVLMERRIKALEMRKRGISFRAIGQALGVSHTQAAKDIQYMLDQYQLPAVDSYRKQQLEEIDDQLTRLYGYMEKPQYITSAKGDVVRGPDGEPLLDREYYLKVEDRIARQLEMRAKLVGTYAADKQEVTVTTVDAMDLEVMKMQAEIEARAKAREQA